MYFTYSISLSLFFFFAKFLFESPPPPVSVGVGNLRASRTGKNQCNVLKYVYLLVWVKTREKLINVHLLLSCSVV